MVENKQMKEPTDKITGKSEPVRLARNDQIRDRERGKDDRGNEDPAALPARVELLARTPHENRQRSEYGELHQHRRGGADELLHRHRA